VLKLDVFNEHFTQWVEKYNNSTHSSLETTPLKKYSSKLECIRPAPDRLIDYFRIVKQRRVYKDRTFRINGKIYEAPAVLIDRKVDLHYHQNDEDNIEIFFDGRSFGMCTLLDKYVNSRVGRDHRPKNGELFDGEKE
jgi:hypothetical protein